MSFKLYAPSGTIILKYCLFTVLFLSAAQSLRANNYYFSSSTGNDSYTTAQAQNQSTPWRTLAKLNSYFNSLVAGDVVYFKKGDVFAGSITATRSGSSGKPIIFTSYGTGNRPVISGLSTIGSWTSLGNNIYQATVSGASSALNLVSINGVPHEMGRYPNLSYDKDPYLYNESSGFNSIVDNQLTSGTNWTGAYAVIRKKRWVMDRCKITSQVGGLLNYATPAGSSYTIGLTGFGYFIQNDPRTLDQFGEWYLNPTTKALQVHFGGNQPSGYTVKVSTVDNIVNLGANSFITLRDLSIEGGNVTGLLAQNGSDISVQQCDFSLMGKDGIVIRNSPNALIEFTNVSYVMNNGINMANVNSYNSTIRNCNIKNIGMMPGMGGDGDGAYVGLGLAVNTDATIEYNNVDSIGHDGIQFQGSNINVRYNFVKNYCFVKDDGGGIYTVGSPNKYVNRKVYNNIVLYGHGVGFGSSGKTAEAEGIYMDRGTNNVEIYDNSVAYMGRACFLTNNANNIKIKGNTAFDARWGVEFSRIPGDQQVRNIELKNNIIYPRTDGQNTVYYKNFALNVPVPISIQQDIQSFGTIDSNYYGTATALPFGYNYSLNDGGAILSGNFNLTNWKSFIKDDATSKNPVKTPDSEDDVRFEYNASTVDKTITLDATYVDVENTAYNGTITLAPYTSALLIKSGAIVTTPSGQTLQAATRVPAINCTGTTVTVAVSGSGGTLPYSGTGNFSTNSGKGALKLSFPSAVTNRSTVLYAAFGAISANKFYTLRFSTVGTTENGKLSVSLRHFGSPATLLTSPQTNTFGTDKVEHQYLFTPTASDANARFNIEVNQASGTTYIDNIAIFETDSDGVNLNSSNLVTNGQFETNISGINVWSSNSNQVAEWDVTGKINNINYYTITDARGTKSTVGVEIKQPAVTLSAVAKADPIDVFGGTTTITVSGSGGSFPYTGTGDFDVTSGTYSYTIKDDNGCSATTRITISQPVGNVAGPTAVALAGQLNCSGTTSTVTVRATGGTAPYTGTGAYNTNAGKGSLKLSFPTSTSDRTTVLFAPVGAIKANTNYVLKFSTLGTTNNGEIKLFLRQYDPVFLPLAAPVTDISYGTTRVDHEYTFKTTDADDNGRVDIEIFQSSGTTYIDNIAFFEADSDGDLVSSNLVSNGQFENDINGIEIWSSNNNEVAEWDNTSKINNINYYTVTDANGLKSTAEIEIKQSATPLSASVTLGGSNILTVTASGGSDPYIGIGTFVPKLGLNTFTVRDANGCSVVASINILSLLAGRVANPAESSASTSNRAMTDITTLPAKPIGLKVSSYPNPAVTDFGLVVEGGTSEKIEVSVMSADGKLIYKTTGGSNKTYKFGNNFISGLYIVKVAQGNNVQTLKLVKVNR